MTRDEAEARWGPDPDEWPRWDCSQCPEHQANVGWVLECGRCGAARDAGWAKPNATGPTHVDRIALSSPLGSERETLLGRYPTADDPAIGAQERDGRATYVRVSEPHVMADCPFPRTQGGYVLRLGPADRSSGKVTQLSVHQCPRCAALVVEDFMAEHEAWHIRK